MSIRTIQDVYDEVCKLQARYEAEEEKLIFSENKKAIDALECVKRLMQTVKNEVINGK